MAGIGQARFSSSQQSLQQETAPPRELVEPTGTPPSTLAAFKGELTDSKGVSSSSATPKAQTDGAAELSLGERTASVVSQPSLEAAVKDLRPCFESFLSEGQLKEQVAGLLADFKGSSAEFNAHALREVFKASLGSTVEVLLEKVPASQRAAVRAKLNDLATQMHDRIDMRGDEQLRVELSMRSGLAARFGAELERARNAALADNQSSAGN